MQNMPKCMLNTHNSKRKKDLQTLQDFKTIPVNSWNYFDQQGFEASDIFVNCFKKKKLIS